MSHLQIVDQGEIFRNPLPGHRVINCFFPAGVVLDNGEILVVARVAAAMYSVQGALELFRSTDGGRTWQRQGPPRDVSEDRVQFNYRLGEMALMRDGSVVLKMNRTPHADEDVLLFNAETGGVLEGQTCYLRSTDGGRTWSQPLPIHLDEPFEPRHVYEATGRMIELTDGTWFQAFETWKHHDDANPYDLNTYGMFSSDSGRSWGGRIPIAVGRDEGRSYSHGMPIQLSDGRVFISLWTARFDLDAFYDLHMVRSTDATCRRWVGPRPLGIPGQSSGAVELKDGRILLIYSHRDDTDQPGIKVVMSDDAGDCFDAREPLVVWDAYGKEALGVPRTDKYPGKHDAIAYGAPRILRLSEREALAILWCTQSADTHCRWTRVQVTNQ